MLFSTIKEQSSSCNTLEHLESSSTKYYKWTNCIQIMCSKKTEIHTSLMTNFNVSITLSMLLFFGYMFTTLVKNSRHISLNHHLSS